jgi:hypothetical protein
MSVLEKTSELTMLPDVVYGLIDGKSYPPTVIPSPINAITRVC